MADAEPVESGLITEEELDQLRTSLGLSAYPDLKLTARLLHSYRLYQLAFFDLQVVLDDARNAVNQLRGNHFGTTDETNQE